MIKRRAFIGLLGGAVASLPLGAYAQPDARMRRVGVLLGGDERGYGQRLTVFRRSMEQLGWSEGRNLAMDIRWSHNDADRTKALAAELVSRAPEVILAGPSGVVIQLQQRTRSIPIVFVTVSDPIGQGIVDSLARPTGNTTGFSNLEFSLVGKWLQLLKEIAPGITRVAMMISTINAASANWYRMLDSVAPAFAVEPVAAPFREVAEIERTIEALARRRTSGLIVAGDTVVVSPAVRRLIVETAARHRVPTLYGRSEFVPEGGLMSYGIDQLDPYRLAAGYVDRILKGERPSDLPVQQPTKFELMINLRTAKALGLTVPNTLLVSADEVIE